MKDPLLTKIGEKIRDERLKKNLTQETLAAKTGVHRTYVGMIERGEKNITIINLKKVCRALNISLEAFFKDF